MTGTQDRYTLPDIPEIGRINGREVAAYTHLLLALLQRSDRFCCGTAPAAYTRALLPKAKAWIKKIEDSVALGGESAGAATCLVPALKGVDIPQHRASEKGLVALMKTLCHGTEQVGVGNAPASCGAGFESRHIATAGEIARCGTSERDAVEHVEAFQGGHKSVGRHESH